jgi:hypothetical protein
MPSFRLCMRHTLPQALSRVRSNREGSDYACATRKSNAYKAVAQWRSFWPRALVCACFFEAPRSSPPNRRGSATLTRSVGEECRE